MINYRNILRTILDVFFDKTPSYLGSCHVAQQLKVYFLLHQEGDYVQQSLEGQKKVIELLEQIHSDLNAHKELLQLIALTLQNQSANFQM